MGRALGDLQMAGNLGHAESPGASTTDKAQQRRPAGRLPHFVSLVLFACVRHRPTQYGLADTFRKYLLDLLQNTCLYGRINTDKRFVVPNREIRIGERS